MREQDAHNTSWPPAMSYYKYARSFTAHFFSFSASNKHHAFHTDYRNQYQRHLLHIATV